MPTRIDEMLLMLDSPNPSIRARALLLLAHEQHMLPLEQLTLLYNSGTAEIRLAVLKYLSRNLPPGHIDFALKALSDPANSVRIKAIDHLISYPDPKAAKALEDVIRSSDFPRKDLAIRALEACDDGRALSLLLSIVEDPHHPERMLASSIVSRLGVQSVISRMLELLASDDEMTVRVAIAALTYTHDQRIIEPILKVIERWEPVSRSSITDGAISLLDKFRDTHIRSVLLQLLRANNDSDVFADITRSSAIHQLANYPEPNVIQYLTELLRNGSQSTRNAAIHAFTKIGGRQSVDMLLSTCISESDPVTLANYSSAFGTLQDKRAIPILEAMLERIEIPYNSIIEFNLRALNPPPSQPNHGNLLTTLKQRFHPRH